ncbi:MAG: AAA family ATPase [Flavobacteriaceae bacterium]|nr:AAA family ATPase [Flavobacteriaceae bacterium]
MDINDFKTVLFKNSSFKLTLSQRLALAEITNFLFLKGNNSIFILKGYAGTGKTSLIALIVNNLYKISYKTRIIAPTGRAAKVLSGYSKKNAYTIHKQIYFSKTEDGGTLSFKIKPNKHKKTVFIVDESSMISDDEIKQNSNSKLSLLVDLIKYVDSGIECKIIFVGDPLQLPPVNSDISPALDRFNLEQKFKKDVYEFELDEVVRQEKKSMVLINAVNIRDCINLRNFIEFKFLVNNDNVVHLEQDEIFDKLDYCMNIKDLSETIVIVYSNKRAFQYNSQIRSKILSLESDLSVGDQLMVVKNNYYWLSPNSIPGFIANGDIIKVLEIISYHDIYEFKFAKVIVKLVDYPNEDEFETILLLSVLNSENPSLNYEESNKFYKEVHKDYSNIKSKYKKYLEIKNNPFFNALQVKYSYAITCHKAQGGQWKNVFLEQPYLKDGLNKAYFRWLYTAFTRSKKRVYLIGFNRNVVKKL